MARRGGWRRLGRKRFRYVDSRGRVIESDADLERIRSLAIPPAWRDVWISPTVSAKLQATGIDVAGRRQYVYHPEYRARQERTKFERLLRFGTLLPDLRAETSRHLRLDPFEKLWTSAVAVSIINYAWFRVGSDRYAQSSRTYGITTLGKRHATVDETEITLCFRTKGRQLVRRKVKNARLARAVGELLVLPGGSRLFRYHRDGDVANLTAPVLNEYIAQYLGSEFTAKDFRTWGGTLVAATALAGHGPSATEAEAKRAVASALRRVGRELGNTPAVARASYVSPKVIERYHAGYTLEDFRRSRSRAHLSADEQALLALLQSHRTR